jgi:transposase
MGAPYAQDLRDRVLAAYDRGMKTKEIADVFQVSRAWARRVKQRLRETGETTPRSMGGVTVIKIDLALLSNLVKHRPDATVRELHAMLGIDCSESGVWLALKRLGLSFKKRQSMPPNKTARTLPAGVRRGNASNQRFSRNG